MNLYLTRARPKQGHICSGANVTMTNAEGTIVGYVTPAVADWLIQQGTAMGMTERMAD